MKTELTHIWVNKVLGTFSFRCCFVWDSYLLHAKKIQLLKCSYSNVSIVPGGCRKYIQAPDVSWNKPFKVLATEKYDQWLTEEGINQLISAGNLKLSPRRTIVNWILEAWEGISPEAIKKSYKSCTLDLAR